MKITFLGTKGYIDSTNKKHMFHTSTLISYKNTKVIIDYGFGWELRPTNVDAIILTHWHPDHTQGLQKNDSPNSVPVYATRKTWQYMNKKKFPITNKKIVKYRHKFRIGDIQFEAYKVIHTMSYDAVGYQITAGNKKIFLVSDVISIYDKEEALKNIDLYIGDGSTILEPLIRKNKQTGLIYGHTTIKAQASFCSKNNVQMMYITHCGTEIIENTELENKKIMKAISEKYNIPIYIASDGKIIII